MSTFMALETASSRDGTSRVKCDRTGLRAAGAMGTRYGVAVEMLPERILLVGRFTLVLALGAWSCSCDLDSFAEPSVAASCSSIGSQCSLPNGPLGVCQEAPCVGGAKPPCFKCTAQH